jgi:hypothetical protein
MYRKSTTTERQHRRYDFLTEVDPERLKLIAAIALAWNWIEATIDMALGTSLRIAPRLLVEVQSRINGFDGKTAIIKAAIPTLVADMPDDVKAAVSKALNAAEVYKSTRDHIVHMRLAHPDEEISETFLRRGATKEVYAAVEPLRAFYAVLSAHLDEINSLGNMCLYLALIERGRDDQQSRAQMIKAYLHAQAQLLKHQQARESLPPLPEVPEPEPIPESQTALEVTKEILD